MFLKGDNKYVKSWVARGDIPSFLLFQGKISKAIRISIQNLKFVEGLTYMYTTVILIQLLKSYQKTLKEIRKMYLKGRDKE